MDNSARITLLNLNILKILMVGFVILAQSLDGISQNKIKPDATDVVGGFGYPPTWNPVPINLAIPPHYVWITVAANPRINSIPLVEGDYIGGFFIDDYGQMQCGGAYYWKGDSTTVIKLSADNANTPEKDGFSYGELLNYKVFSWTTQKTYDVDIFSYEPGSSSANWAPLETSKINNMQCLEVFDAYASANPNPVCFNNQVNLAANIFIGTTGNYTFTWTSNPTGFSSNLQYPPAVTPLVNTTYNLSVFDGILTSTHQLLVVINQNPSLVNAGTDATICRTQQSVSLSGSATNFGSVLWTTSGTGVFNNATLFTPVYTPSTDDRQNGSVILTLNALPLSGCTLVATDDKILTILPLPNVFAGNDKSVCKGSNVMLDATTAVGYSAVTWSTTGTGTFSNKYILNPQYFPSATELSNGSCNLTITINALSPCTGTATDQIKITFIPPPTAGAATSRTMCEGAGSLALSGTGVTNYSSLLWQTAGDGTFNNPNQLSIVYYPGTNDNQNGGTILTLNALPNTPCSTAASQQVTLNITRLPIIDAGDTDKVCLNKTLQLNANASYANNYTWATSGTGNFSNKYILNPIYTPSTADYAAGQFTLTLTGYLSGTCGQYTVSDNLLVEVVEAPFVQITTPSNQTICANPPLQLNATGYDYDYLAWTTSGNGSFSNASILSPVYTPGTSDVSGTPIVLTLTGYAVVNCGANSVKQISVSFKSTPTASAGTDASICQGSTHTLAGTATNQASVLWSTSGTGTFSSASSLTPVYTPGTADITTGTVTLTLTASAVSPCTAAASDTKILFIQKTPTANAGSDATVCQGSTHTLTGTASSQASILWTTSGTGTFSSTTSLTPVYTPSTADITAGTVILTLTASAISPCTNATSDGKILVIRKTPIVNAGADASICQGSTHTLAGTASNQGTLAWTTSGTGTFSSTTSLTPVYTPSTADITTGTVTLTLTATAVSPCTGSVTDSKILSIQKAPTANAGADATICQGSTHQVLGTVANNAGFSWTTSGTGTFSSTTSLSPVYTPGTADITAGTVTLTLTASAVSPCTASVSDVKILVIRKNPTANAGNDATICQGSTHTLAGVVTNQASVFWTTSGNGTFNSTSSLSPVYTPGTADITTGSVTLTLTVSALIPCTASASDFTILTIQKAPTVSAGADATICGGNTHNLNGAATNYGSLTWSTSGDGTFSSTGIVNPVYSPGLLDIGTGSVSLILYAPAISPCTFSVDDTTILVIQKTPVAYAGEDATVTPGVAYATESAFAQNATSIIWSTSGDGVFENINVLHTFYNPGNDDNNNGSVKLTLKANGDFCNDSIDDLDLFIMIPTGSPTAYAGLHDTICENDVFYLTTASASNFSSLLWSTTGDGTFNNNTLLNPVYTPGINDKATGMVQLCIKAFPIEPFTYQASDCLFLSIQKLPTVNAGTDATICQGSTHTLAGTATNQGTLAWTTSGTGTFSSTSSLTPVYTPSVADVTNGTITLTLLASPVSPCTINASDSKILNIQKAPTANSGADASICQGSTHTLDGTATNQGTVAWTTSGTGTFTSASSLSPIYTPGNADVTAGTVTLTLTASAISPCTVSASDSKTLIIRKNPTANAGTDATICQGSTHTLAGTATNQGTVAWTTSGTGTFSSASSLTPVYTPSTADITAGTLTLTLTASAILPCTTSTSDSKTLIIRKNPTANAGTDATICQGSTHTLAGTATNHASVLWTTSGNGTFSSTSSLTPVYTPGTTDVTNGIVTLTLTASAISPCIVSAADNKTLVIQKTPTVYAGNDASICQGSTHTLAGTATNYGTLTWATSGNGTFSSTSSLNPIYTPGNTDITAGTVTLTLTASAVSPCTASVSDSKTLIIQKNPTANAGSDATICQGGTHTLAGTATNQGTLTWTTSGNGTFSSTSSLTPVYTPGTADITAGTVTLTLTVSSISPCTASASDSKTLIIRINPTANAGTDATICQGSTHTLAGTASNQGTVAWTTSGNGTFSSTSSLTTVYTPGNLDITAGTVTLTLTVSAVSPCTVSASDSKTLIIRKNPAANAGADASICEGSTHTLAGAATNQGTINWTTSGTGTFSLTTIVNPVYTPSAADETTGTVTLTLTASAVSPCTVSASDSKTLVIRKTPTANAGADATICQGSTHSLAGTATNQGTIVWTTSGTGTFSSTSSLTPIYTPGNADITTGSVTLTLTVSAVAPCTVSASDSKTLVIRKNPTANAGADASICQGSTHTLAGTATNQGTIVWTTSGTGTFSSTSSLTPIYTPGNADITTGSVTLTLTVSAVSPCTISSSDSKFLIIQKTPTANAGADATICQGSIHTLAGTATNQGTVTWSTSGNGTFSSASSLTPVYTPGNTDITAGTVTLTLTASAVSPCTASVSDTKTLIIQKNPTANAGSDATICQGGTHTLTGTATNQGTVTWTTSGNGTFSSASSLTPIYTPGTADVVAGIVTLTLTTTAVSPCTVSGSDSKYLIIQKNPTANAGSDATICQGSTHTLTGNATNFGTVAWATSGNGTFSSTSSLTAVYTPGTADITAGTITLTLTVAAVSPCTTSTVDTKTLIIQKSPMADIGTDATICEGSTHQVTGSVSNNTSYSWTTSGTGTFSSTSSLTPIYTPGAADIATGAVTLTLIANGISPCTSPASDNKILTIQKSPIANAGADANVPPDSTYSTENAFVVNATSVIWSTSGDGVFNNAAVLHTIYTPGVADINNGTVSLTLTASNAYCNPVSDNVILLFTLPTGGPNAFAGEDATICESGNIGLANAAATNYSALLWSTTGDGSFNNVAVLNPVYTPGPVDKSSGIVQLCLKAMPVSPYTIEATDCMLLSVQKNPTANAGTDATICQGNTHTLAGIASNQGTVIWTTSGNGTFSSTSSLTPVYTPGTADVLAGTVSLTLTATAISLCTASISDSKTLIIQKTPITNAGTDAAICQGSTHTLTGTATNQASVLWSTSGNGTFSSTSSLTSVYTPGTTDVSAGIVTLTLTVSAISPCTASVSDSKTLIIQKTPTTIAGTDATICQGSTHTLVGTASNQGTLIWTTSGNGTFSSTSSLTPIYTPGNADVLAGTVTLTLTATAISPCTASISDSKILIIQKTPTTNAGTDATICQGSTHTLVGTASNQGTASWTTSGDGTYSSTSSLTPIYTPGNADVLAGTCTLTLTATAISPCTASISDSKILIIQKIPTTNAGTDASICQGNTHTLAGTASNQGTVAWTTSGDGTYSSTSSLTPIYTPGNADVLAGTVSLTLTVTAVSPCPGTASDSKILVIQKTSTANAGADATVCQGSSHTLAGAATNQGTVVWTTSGNGTFSSTSSLTPIYTPGNADVSAGTVTLTLTVSAVSPCSGTASDSKILVIQKTPIANAGADATVCQGSTHTLAGTATNQGTIVWTTSGNGTFSSTNSLTPVYTPGTADVSAGTVTLTLTVAAVSPCSGTASDSKILVIQKTPIANAGVNATICQGVTHTLAGTASNYGTLAWTTSGNGTFSSASSLNPVYTPGPADVSAGSVTLNLTASAILPCTLSDVKSMVLTIIFGSTASAGADMDVCVNSSVALLNSSSSFYTSLLWTTNGDGSFDNNAILHPNYTPGAQDLASGTATLCLNSTGSANCGNATDCMVLHFIPIPQIELGILADTVCFYESYTMSQVQCTNYDLIQWFTVNGAGFFDNEMLLNPTYFPSPMIDYSQGCIIVGVSASPISPCAVSDEDFMNLCFQEPATVMAGADATICQTETHTLSGNASNYENVLWTTSGNGVFSSTSSLTPVYTPGSAEIEAGFVTLTLTVHANAGCDDKSDSNILTIQKTPVVDAGADVTILQTESFLVSATASNYSSLQWSTSGDGIFSSTSSLTPVYTPGSADIANSTVVLSLAAFSVSPCQGQTIDEITLTLSTAQQQFIQLNSGWNGLSSFVIPSNPAFDQVMAPIANNLIIVKNMLQVYWPEFGINTIGNFDPANGYLVKMNAAATLPISGFEFGNKTINLTAGWNILPVLSPVNIGYQQLITQLGNELVIVTEIAGTGIIWPDEGIYTIPFLLPGKAYWIKVRSQCNFTFPD